MAKWSRRGSWGWMRGLVGEVTLPNGRVVMSPVDSDGNAISARDISLQTSDNATGKGMFRYAIGRERFPKGWEPVSKVTYRQDFKAMTGRFPNDTELY